MDWMIFFRKVSQAFLAGATASVGEMTATGQLGDAGTPEGMLQHSVIGAIMAGIIGLSNYLKQR